MGSAAKKLYLRPQPHIVADGAYNVQLRPSGRNSVLLCAAPGALRCTVLPVGSKQLVKISLYDQNPPAPAMIGIADGQFPECVAVLQGSGQCAGYDAPSSDRGAPFRPMRVGLIGHASACTSPHRGKTKKPHNAYRITKSISTPKTRPCHVEIVCHLRLFNLMTFPHVSGCRPPGVRIWSKATMISRRL